MYTVSRQVEHYPLYNCADRFNDLKAARKAYTWLLKSSQYISLSCGEIVLELTDSTKTVIRKHILYLTGREPIVEWDRKMVTVGNNRYPTAKVFYNDKMHEVLGLYEGYGCKPSDDKRFLFGNELGPTHLVISDSWYNAYDAVIDASHTVGNTSDLWEGDDLQGGYDFQSNSSGSGIVDTQYIWSVEWDEKLKGWYPGRGC